LDFKEEGGEWERFYHFDWFNLKMLVWKGGWFIGIWG
jgi:hypothetical protein